jgi:hypothetical protein
MSFETDAYARRVARLASKLQIKAGPEFAVALERYERAAALDEAEAHAHWIARSERAKAAWARRRANNVARAK